MNLLRVIFKWVARHRALSIAAIAVFCAAAPLVRISVKRSAGQLSEPISRTSIVQAVYGIGTVTANQSYQLKPGVTSTITTLFVNEGDTVKKGARLAQLDQIVYRAPFDGTIVNLPFKVGENVFANIPAVTVVNLEDRYVVVTLEQQGALRIKAGQKARLSFDTIREETYEGKVRSVYSYQNSFLARIDCPGMPARILPGMTADVAIEIRQHDNTLVVPVASYDRGILWVKRGNAIPQKIEVKTGIIDKDKLEIVAGDLEPGDRVLVRKDLSP